MSGNKFFRQKIITLIKNRNKDFSIFIFYVVYGIFFNWYFLKEHFSIDSYPTLFYQERIGISIIGTGRALYGLILYILAKLDFFLVSHQGIIMAISIFFLALAALLLKNINQEIVLQKKIPINRRIVEIVSSISALLVIYNAFQSSMTPFIEMYVGSCLSLLLTVFAIRLFLNEKKIVSFLVLITSLFIYQSWIVLYLGYLLLIFLINGKKIINSLFCAGSLYFFAIMINYFISSVLVKLFDLPRWRIGAIDFQQIMVQLKILPQHMIDIITHSYSYLPRNFLLYAILIFSVLIIIESLRKRIFLPILVLIISSIAYFIVPLVPTLISDNSFITIRMVIAASSIIGFLILVQFIFFGENRKVIIFLIFTGMVSATTFFNFSLIGGRNIIEVNKKDEDDVILINNIIKKSENKNNIFINKIAFLKDSNITPCRTSVCMPSISETFFIADWASFEGFNYFSNKNFNRTFKKVEPHEVLSEQEVYDLRSADFHKVSEESILIKNDSAIVVIY